MKQIIFLTALILALAGPAFADAYFSNRALSELRVTQFDAQGNSATMQDIAGDTATVHIGDTIGQSAATIIKISNLFVVVKTVEGTTQIPVTRTAHIGNNRIGFH